MRATKSSFYIKTLLFFLVAVKVDLNTANEFFWNNGKLEDTKIRDTAKCRVLDIEPIMIPSTLIGEADFGKAPAIRQVGYSGSSLPHGNLMFLTSAVYSYNSIPSQYEVILLNNRDLFQSQFEKNENSITKSHNRSKTIRYLIYKSAKKHGIPARWFEKLIYFESRFNPSARSYRGAMGLGQLMPATARELGLKVTSSKDRSNGSVWHPASNLDASAKYLRQLHRLYVRKGIARDEAWSFAAGAYNAGMGNIQKAMNLTGNRDYRSWKKVAKKLYRITGSSSWETIRYVKRLKV